MNSRIEIANLRVDATLFEFINTEVLPPLKFNNLEFWRGSRIDSGTTWAFSSMRNQPSRID